MPIISIKDIIDILLFATILYGVFRLLRRSGAVNLFWGILVFVLIWFIVRYVFHLELTGAVFNRVISVGAIALIVIFQNEIRSFFYNVGFHIGRLSHRFSGNSKDAHSKAIDQLVSACKNMSSSRTGALIVLEGHQDLSEYADTGERLDARLSVRFVEQIFYKNTPLHDGALLVRGNRLLSASCVLPLASDRDIPKQYGLRHRAGLGIAEQTDAVAIIVSEQTGEICLAYGDTLETVVPDHLSERVEVLWNGL